MEAINGVTFRDYACACANLAGGMSLDKICTVLGIEEPVWATVMDGWNKKMAELTHEDMAFYGEVFTNPKQGKFANVAGAAEGPEKAIAKVPTLEEYLSIFWHQSLAHEQGIDLSTLFEE